MADTKAIEAAKEQFGAVLAQQLERVERLKAEQDWVDYSEVSPIVVGMIGGDGIGPFIAAESQRVLEFLLKDQVAGGKVEFRTNRGPDHREPGREAEEHPDDVLADIKQCHVTLKGPTHTPERGDGWPTWRAPTCPCARSWTCSPTSGRCASPGRASTGPSSGRTPRTCTPSAAQGVNVTEDLGIDFRVITSQGSERIIDAAFAHAQRTGKDTVTVVTKANIVKTTDGKFLDIARKVSEKYPNIGWEGWYIDIMTAALINPARQKQFQVLVLPNLYGDILTDEAAQIQGGVGTAGSANVGKRYGMFEAIHGSAPRMVREGRAQYADPSSMMRAGAMLLTHIGFEQQGDKLHKALDICGQYERKIAITGRDTGCTSQELGEYIMSTVEDPDLDSRWDEYVKG